MVGPAAPPDAWLDADLALLRDDEGWAPVRAPADLVLHRRPCADDPNHLFRWRIELPVPPDVVQADFVDRILELHPHWTREYVGGDVLRDGGLHDRVLAQRFDPGIPGISRRDVCHRSVVRVLPDGAFLTSHRPDDALPAAPGWVRILWWGASLVEPGDTPCTTSLTYLDRENQGGWIPAWGMNLAMPGYLVTQAQAVKSYFAAL